MANMSTRDIEYTAFLDMNGVVLIFFAIQMLYTNGLTIMVDSIANFIEFLNLFGYLGPSCSLLDLDGIELTFFAIRMFCNDRLTIIIDSVTNFIRFLSLFGT